jgi:hypothetical protein
MFRSAAPSAAPIPRVKRICIAAEVNQLYVFKPPCGCASSPIQGRIGGDHFCNTAAVAISTVIDYPLFISVRSFAGPNPEFRYFLRDKRNCKTVLVD